MRVLHTIASLRPETGGPARSVPGLAAAIAGSGVDVSLWAADVPARYEVPGGVELLKGDIRESIACLDTFDLVHDHGLWLPINHAIAKATAAAGIPRMVSPRGMLEPWALNHRKWKKRLAWFAYQKRDLERSAALHATAESEAEQFRKLGLTPPGFVIPNGVELPNQGSSFAKGSEDKQRKRTALFLSRVHPKKGLPILVDAWARVRPEGWRMRVVGPDEDGHRGEIESMVRRLGLEADWTLEGPLEGARKADAFAEADLFILPTHSENFGIAVAEALAAGLPVITTTGAPWRRLIESRSGWWVEPTSNSLADVLKEACRLGSGDLEAMGTRGRALVQREFSWSGIASQMIEAYERTLSKR